MEIEVPSYEAVIFQILCDYLYLSGPHWEWKYQFPSLASRSYNFGFLRVAYFPQLCADGLYGHAFVPLKLTQKGLGQMNMWDAGSDIKGFVLLFVLF